MKVVYWILGSLVGLFVLLLIISLFLPSHCHLERTRVVGAPADTVYAVLIDPHQYQAWSPWSEIDPAHTTYTYFGPPTGPGSGFRWSSPNDSVGNGEYRITHVKPGQHVGVGLMFDGMGGSTADMHLERASASSTRVTWSFDSEFDGFPLMRFFGLFMGSMIGPDYEKGLVKMDKYVQSKM